MTTDLQNDVEVWRPVYRHERGYEVSTWGNVRDLATGRVMRPFQNDRGLPAVAIYNKWGRRNDPHVGMLVAETFIGLRPDNAVLWHNDGNVWNSRLDNVCWLDRETAAELRRSSKGPKSAA